MDREPLLTTAGVVAAVTALLTMLVSFGVDLSADQQAGILGVVAVVAPLVVGVARRWVTPAPRGDFGDDFGDDLDGLV